MKSTIKKTLNKLLGEVNVYLLIDIKNRILPSKWYIDEQSLKNKTTQFYSEFIENNSLCFDIGANMGKRTEVMLGLGAKIVAVEPQSRCAEYLRQKLGAKIVVVEKGVGSTTNDVEMLISDNSEICTFDEEFVKSIENTKQKGQKWQSRQIMQMTTLDKLIEKYGKPHFIKIDVEGYELEVLKGLSYLPNYMNFEYTVPEQTSRITDCLSKIENISATALCNYSIAESMKFELSQWLPTHTMKQLILTPEFANSGWGDIYIKKK